MDEFVLRYPANGSARAWVIGEGHVPLPDARRRALDAVEAAEQECWSADVEATVADMRLDRAKAVRDGAERRRAEAVEAFDRARRHLAYVTGLGNEQERRHYRERVAAAAREIVTGES